MIKKNYELMIYGSSFDKKKNVNIIINLITFVIF